MEDKRNKYGVSVWDYKFSEETGELGWIIVHLKNGKKILGLLDEKNGSVASDNTEEEKLYLGEVFPLSYIKSKVNIGKAQDFVVTHAKDNKHNRGMLVFKSEIVGIQFLDWSLFA